MRLFKRNSETIEESTTTAECVHGVRVAHWDSAEDMGHEDRVSNYTCESCGARFSRDEDAALWPTAILTDAERDAA